MLFLSFKGNHVTRCFHREWLPLELKIITVNPYLTHLRISATWNEMLVTRDASNAGALHIFEAYFWSAPATLQRWTSLHPRERSRFLEQSVVLLSLVLVT